MRLAFSGAVSTGKTTTAHALHEELSKTNNSIPIVDTGSRRLIDIMEFSSSGAMSPPQYSIFQLAYIGLKLANESELQSYITERSFIDVYVYWLLEGERRVLDALDDEIWTICSRETKKYDHIFFFRIEDVPFHDDGYRKVDPIFHSSYQQKLAEVYSELGIKVNTVPKGNIEQRVSFIKEVISK